MKSWKGKKTDCNMCEPNCAEGWCNMICDIGYDYDGCLTPQSLKCLIDELVEMAEKAIDCIHANKISINSPTVIEEQNETIKKIKKEKKINN